MKKEQITIFRQALEPHIGNTANAVDQIVFQRLDQALTERDTDNWPYSKVLVSPYRIPELFVLINN